MISLPNTNIQTVSFRSEKKAPAGASFQPPNESPGATDPHAAKEAILRLNPFQRLSLGVKKVCVDIPKSVVHGLQGDRNVSFYDFLQMAAVPYYLGGAMLYNCFRAGGDVLTAKKQGVGVVLYYLGMGLGNNFVDSFVKHKYGVDLNLSYKNLDGKVHKVFESVDFTRWDLLTQKDWDEMGDKLGIPRDVVDRDTAVKAEVGKILVKARAWKLTLGATFAGIGAGFLARSNAWEKLFKNIDTLKTSFKGIFNKTGSAGNFLNTLWSVVKSEVIQPLGSALKELPSTKLGNIPTGKIAMAALIGLPLLALYNIIKTPNRKKVYLTKEQAMPYAGKFEDNKNIRVNVATSINPNDVDYSDLYNKVASQAKAPVAPANIPGGPVTTPFDAFEMFMRRV